jgi:Zn2+/Cd2+-exporting ATPase
MAMDKATTFRIEGMDCPSCTATIESAVCALPGVKNVKLDYQQQRLKLELGEEGVDAQAISRLVNKLGYKVSESKAGPASDKPDPWFKTKKGRMVIISGTLFTLSAALWFVQPDLAFYGFTAAALIALFPMARKAFGAAMVGNPFTIETLVTIAVVGAIIIDQAAEAALVVFLFAVGELLESLAAAQARRSVSALATLTPKTAFLVKRKTTQEVPADSLNIGDQIEVRPGGRIPADGVISRRNTSIDQSPVTGESVPVTRQKGDTVYAGSINADNVIRLRVTKSAQDNMIGRILKLVEEAEASKSPTARFIDQFSKYYTPGVLLVASLIAVVPPLLFGADWMVWIYKGLAILLIGCPCALVLSTPAAITSGIAAGARRGLLMKGGVVLEAIGKVATIAFDKTGTLTAGTPKVTDIHAFSCTQLDMLSLAAAIEASSSHPLAKAIVEEAHKNAVVIAEAGEAKALQGRGVQGVVNGRTITVASPRYAHEIAQISDQQNQIITALEEDGKTVAIVVEDKTAIGLLAMRDELREDAKGTITALKKLGISVVMLTGDNARTGKAIAAQLGMDVRSELMPDAKLSLIETLKENGTVAMVGDGINDAPALARADVGIAMGSGTAVALETADAALLQERVSGVYALVRLSRATLRNIYQNISAALVLKAIFFVTTLMGVTSLWMAILADTGATVLVTLNALRLLKFIPDKDRK